VGSALSVSINLLLNSYTGCVIRHLKHYDEFFGLNLDRKKSLPTKHHYFTYDFVKTQFVIVAICF